MRMLRVTDTGLDGAGANVALTAALVEAHREGRIGDMLRLHRYRRSVLLGMNSPDAAADRTACARLGAEVVRRMSGGGAVAMEPGILAWDLLVARPPGTSPEDLSRAVCTGLAAALSTFGVTAAFRPPGDIVTPRGKLGGTAGFFDGLSMLHQGSLLVAPDPGLMAALLGTERLPVTTLALEVAEPPEMAGVARAVTGAIAAALGCMPVPCAPGPVRGLAVEGAG